MLLHCLLAVSLVSMCACVDRDTVVDLANSNTAFGFNLLNVIQDDEGGNVFLSPFSISTALAMTYLGADGNTREQLATGLQIGGYENSVQLFENLNKWLFRQRASNGYALRQANRLYGKKDISFNSDFSKEMRRYFHAPLYKADFSLDSTREDINMWVEEQTENKIKDLLKDGDLDNAILFIINAIYFKALWMQPFNTQDTFKGDFHITPTRSLKVDMMEHALGKHFNVGVVPGLNARILEMKYKGGVASMFIVLPDEPTGLCEVQEGLTMTKLEEAISGMDDKFTRLLLPKFEFKDRINLKPYLQRLNMTDMFDANAANFSKITNDFDLVVSDVIHQTFVRVDEAGTMAAAATGPVLVATSLQQADSFTINRPFLFFIRDMASESVLFLGRVVDPTDAEDLGTDGYQCEPRVLVYNAQERVAAVVYSPNTNSNGIPVLPMLTTILTAVFIAIVSK